MDENQYKKSTNSTKLPLRGFETNCLVTNADSDVKTDLTSNPIRYFPMYKTV